MRLLSMSHIISRDLGTLLTRILESPRVLLCVRFNDILADNGEILDTQPRKNRDIESPDGDLPDGRALTNDYRNRRKEGGAR